MAVIRYPLIAREGWSAILIAAAAAAVVHVFSPLAALPLWAMALLLGVAFRDPPREVPALPLALLSPVDARVTAVQPQRDERLRRDAVAISLQMLPSGIFSLRSPTEGKVIQQWFEPIEQSAHREAYRRLVWVQTDEGDDVVLVLHPPRLWGRTTCYIQTGERVGQGQRCGFVAFGARVDVLVPTSARVTVKPGDRVYSGIDSLARLAHKQLPE